MAHAYDGRLAKGFPAMRAARQRIRRLPAKIKTLIGELGLRYRPAAAADLAAHGSTLALLARDLSD